MSGAECERGSRKSGEQEREAAERERTPGVTKIGLSGEREIGRSHALVSTNRHTLTEVPVDSFIILFGAQS